MMKRLFFSFSILILLSVINLAQSPSPTPKTAKKPIASKTPKPTKPVTDEKTALEKILALTDLNEKINALKKFVADFPASKELNRALENLVSSPRSTRR